MRPKKRKTTGSDDLFRGAAGINLRARAGSTFRQGRLKLDRRRERTVLQRERPAGH